MGIAGAAMINFYRAYRAARWFQRRYLRHRYVAMLPILINWTIR